MLLMKQNMFLGVSRVVSEKALTAIRHREFLISAGGGGGEKGFLSAFEHPRNLKSGVPRPPENWVPQKELLDSK